ncbi:hypothetical protein ACFX1Q_006192 [Malus domestica]
MGMEHYSFYLNFLLGFIVFVISLSLLALVLLYRHRSQFKGNNLPPGNVGYPLIGESYDFVSAGWKGHPEKFFFDRIANYSSQIFKTSLFGKQAAFFYGAAGNKFLFSNENRLVNVWWPDHVNKIFPTSADVSATAEAKKLKKLIHNFMKPEALKRYIGIMDAITQKHFANSWENKQQVHVFPLAKNYTLAIAARLFLSLEDQKDIDKLGHSLYLANAGVISMPIDFPGTPLRKAIKASKLINGMLTEIIKQRKADLADGKASPTQDILSHMLMTCDKDGTYMKELDISTNIMGLLIGGYEATGAVCTLIVKFLAELPHIYDAVYKEQMEIANSKAPGELLHWDDIQKMKYSWNVAQEVMRLTPPIQGSFREAATDFVFNGYTIPKGWILYWSSITTHKSVDYFQEPDKFDLSRFEGTGPAPCTYVPFGGGPMMCPGKEYARMEILVFMHNLVKRFKCERLLPQEKIVMDPLAMPAKGLPIRLFPHNHIN